MADNKNSGQFGASEGVDPSQAGEQAANEAPSVPTVRKALTLKKRERRVRKHNLKRQGKGGRRS